MKSRINVNYIRKQYFCMLGRIDRMQVITHQHRTPAAAIPSTKRVPNAPIDYKVPLFGSHYCYISYTVIIGCF